MITNQQNWLIHSKFAAIDTCMHWRTRHNLKSVYELLQSEKGHFFTYLFLPKSQTQKRRYCFWLAALCSQGAEQASSPFDFNRLPVSLINSSHVFNFLHLSRDAEI